MLLRDNEKEKEKEKEKVVRKTNEEVQTPKRQPK